MHQQKPRDRKHVNEFSGTLGDEHRNGFVIWGCVKYVPFRILTQT